MSLDNVVYTNLVNICKTVEENAFIKQHIL